MRKIFVMVIVLCSAMAVAAQSGPKNCDELKDEIAKKIEAHGGMNPTLTIVDKGKEGDGKVVGTCGGGTKSILYVKGTAEAPAPKAESKPAPKAEEKKK